MDYEQYYLNLINALNACRYFELLKWENIKIHTAKNYHGKVIPNKYYYKAATFVPTYTPKEDNNLTTPTFVVGIGYMDESEFKEKLNDINFKNKIIEALKAKGKEAYKCGKVYPENYKDKIVQYLQKLNKVYFCKRVKNLKWEDVKLYMNRSSVEAMVKFPTYYIKNGENKNKTANYKVSISLGKKEQVDEELQDPLFREAVTNDLQTLAMKKFGCNLSET